MLIEGSFIFITLWGVCRCPVPLTDDQIDPLDTIAGVMKRSSSKFHCAATILNRNYALTTHSCAMIKGKPEFQGFYPIPL